MLFMMKHTDIVIEGNLYLCSRISYISKVTMTRKNDLFKDVIKKDKTLNSAPYQNHDPRIIKRI